MVAAALMWVEYRSPLKLFPTIYDHDYTGNGIIMDGQPTPTHNMKHYFHLKLGQQNKAAEKWLDSDNPKAAVYFGFTSPAGFAAGKVDKEVQKFIHIGQRYRENDTSLIVMAENKVWLLQPSGPVTLADPEPDKANPGSEHTPKVMPVKVVGGGAIPLISVPEVLATMPANQFIARRTLSEINDWGCLKAIDVAGNFPRSGEHWALDQNSHDQLLECLGSIALETLFAKVLEAAGCHVPAHRGGTLKGIDLLATNDLDKPIKLGPLRITTKETVPIQIKRWAPPQPAPQAGYFFSLGQEDQPLNAKWLLESAKDFPEVWKWFKRSVSWLPEEFLTKLLAKLVLSG